MQPNNNNNNHRSSKPLTISPQQRYQQHNPFGFIPPSFAQNKRGYHSSQETQDYIEKARLAHNINVVHEDDSFPKGAELSPLNGPFNECNSFYSNALSDELFHAIATVLSKEIDLDYETKPRNYRIRGRKFNNHIVCEFQIHMFRVSEYDQCYPNHILVEFQRRSGDSFVFQNFFIDTIHSLQRLNVVTHCDVHSTQCFLQSIPQSNNQDNDYNNNNDDDDDHDHEMSGHYFNGDSSFQCDLLFLTNLLQLIQTGYYQHRRHAAAILARESTKPNVARKLIEVPNLIKCLGEIIRDSLDVQVVRAIGHILCSMMQNSNDFRQQAKNACLGHVLQHVFKRWSKPSETHIGPKKVRVIPSRQVVVSMKSCMELLEGRA